MSKSSSPFYKKMLRAVRRVRIKRTEGARTVFVKLSTGRHCSTVPLFFCSVDNSCVRNKLLPDLAGEEISGAGEEISQQGEEISGAGEGFSQASAGLCGGGNQPKRAGFNGAGEGFSA